MQRTTKPDDTDSAEERSESGGANEKAMEDAQEQAAEEREHSRGYQ